jgi:Xaa-Pro aminopeptidase
LSFDFPGRVVRMQELMGDDGTDVTVLSVGADLPYFTGYEATPSERLTAFVIPAEGEPVLLVPELEAPRVSGLPFEVRPWRETEDPVELAASVGGRPAVVAIGDHMWSIFLMRLQARWAHASFRPASAMTTRLRIVKDDGEVELLRTAAHGVDRVMGRIPAEVKFAGRTETQVARDLAAMTIDEGHDVAEFTIVAAGANGASPHHHPGDKVVEPGDLVVCDFGGRVGGYYSDSTRTFVVGEPTTEQQEVHDLVAAANETGRALAAPGVTCEEIDRATRSVIEEAGHGARFIHRTGHGIGLEVHERPYLVAGDETALVPGMSFSIEPGVYLPGRFGVRIEDIVVCTADGAESLNRSTRALVSVS